MTAPRLPLAGGDLYARVMDAAGWRCQCTGTCGTRCTLAYDARCCEHDDDHAGLLHAVPTPGGHVALCDPCHARTLRTTARARQAAAAEAQSALF
jgi:hypothetical protein